MELLDRFEAGQHLHLEQRPVSVDWTGFKILPGLSDDVVELLKAEKE
ncbi:hypothetical protein [Methanolapillus africanus]